MPSGFELRIGIDLGGTKIEIIALADDGVVLLRRRIATPQGDYLATVMAIAGLVEAVENELHRHGSVGIGVPGAESRASGLIKNANSTCLIGKPLRRDLQALLQREIRLANDANCFALSEAVDGAARDAGMVFGVILGTGVGGGIVFNGKVWVGANAIAGEWGHNPLPGAGDDGFPPPACYCGRQGCIETYLSGPGLAADHARHTGQQIGASTHLDAAAIAAEAAAGEPEAQATLMRYQERLGRALAGVVNILDPDVIVLGGGLSGLDQLYRNLPSICGQHVFSDNFRTPIRAPVHGDSSGVRGAAWLWN